MDRRRLRGITALVSPALERRGFLAAFTERTGGISERPFDSLNLGMRAGDRADRVVENRYRLIRALDVPPFAAAEQVHDARLARVGEKRGGAGFRDRTGSIQGVDALAVTRPGIPVAVFVADCLPIALASQAQGRVVAVHAGWRGLARGILSRALAAFDPGHRVVAAIGPAVGPCHYEVGEEVALAVAAGSAGGAVTERRNGRLYLDLAETAARVLRTAGVRTVERADLCTACERRRFFSHRRDGETGRQALVAMRL